MGRPARPSQEAARPIYQIAEVLARGSSHILNQLSILPADSNGILPGTNRTMAPAYRYNGRAMTPGALVSL